MRGVLDCKETNVYEYTIDGRFGKVEKHPLWPSESWRWLGIILNGVGALAGIVVVVNAMKWMK